jgi:hypothetical protein
MQADPGGIVIPAVDNFPENEVRLHPGASIHGTDVDGCPEILKTEPRDASEIDIRDYGDGEHRKCPTP